MNSKEKILQLVSSDLGQFLLSMKELGKNRNIPNISWDTALFLIEKLRTRNISNILEIGPANGFSTMMLALACPNAEITTIECSRHAFEELRHNIQAFYVLQEQREKSKEKRGGLFKNLDKVPFLKGRSDKLTPSNEGGKISGGDVRQSGQGDLLGTNPSPSLKDHCIINPPNLILNDSPPSRRGFPNPANFPPKVTSEINQETIGNFQLYYADARELLPAFQEGVEKVVCKNPESILTDIPAKKFDFIFIDGAFRMTREFFDLSLPLLNSDGIIILDDAIKYRWKMEGFHEYLEEQKIHFELVQTDEDDGVMVIDNVQCIMYNV